jgi:hypothetical protein
VAAATLHDATCIGHFMATCTTAAIESMLKGTNVIGLLKLKAVDEVVTGSDVLVTVMLFVQTSVHWSVQSIILRYDVV